MDRLIQACFPVFRTVCLELAATNGSDQRLYVCFQIQTSLLRLILNTDLTCRHRL